MQIVISPTKQMNSSIPENINIRSTKPLFLTKAIVINNQLKSLSEEEVSTLMNTSQKITVDSVDSISRFEKKDTLRIPAIAAYSGTVFKEINFKGFNNDDIKFASKSLFIFSAKYGLLRATDEICKYRLEAKTPLKMENKNLYSYWSEDVTNYLSKSNRLILNLASEEYSKLLSKELGDRVINIQFKVKKENKLRTVGHYSKVARGKMVNAIIKKGIEIPELIKDISVNEFNFSQLHSGERDWVFVREQ